MLILRKIAELKEYCQKKSIVFVPTMGYLHEGHLSLIKKAQTLWGDVLVSIFVNPLQFNNMADLQNYPRNEERDIELLKKEKVSAVFVPTIDEIYPKGAPQIRLYHPLMQELCGKYRPGHFEGVLYIVHNLFQWINPRYALFGKKDYQQWLLVKAMVEELAFSVEIIACPTIRDSDGLALSSRNARLSNENRQIAKKIPLSLYKAYQKYMAKATIKEIKQVLQENLQEFKIDYAGVFDPHTLKPLSEDGVAQEGLIALAVYVGDVRLIDNLLLGDDEAFLYLEKLLSKGQKLDDSLY